MYTWWHMVLRIGRTAVVSVSCINQSDYNGIAVIVYTMYIGPTNALVCNKTLIQVSHTKTFKITPTCFDHQMIIIRWLFDPG
jgi:hypothetical protein